MKGICKLASRVLKTRVPYKTRVLKTRFLHADLDTFLPHRSRVFYTRFQNTQNKPSIKKERRRRSAAKKKIHSKEEDPWHTQT